MKDLKPKTKTKLEDFSVLKIEEVFLFGRSSRNHVFTFFSNSNFIVEIAIEGYFLLMFHKQHTSQW